MGLRRAVVALCVLTSVAWSQGQPAPLTEQAAVQLALGNHPDLAVAVADAEMAQARVEAAISSSRLQVSANGLATISDMAGGIATQDVMPRALLRSQDRSAVDLNAMAMVPLSTGGRIEQSIRAAQMDAAAADDLIAAGRAEVAYRARLALAQWRRTLAMAQVARATLEAQLKSSQVVEHQFGVGKAPRFDLLRSQAELAAAKQAITQADADAFSARARLAQALGVPEDTLFAPAEEPPASVPPDALELALGQRPELLAAQRTIEAAQARSAQVVASYKAQAYGVGMLDIAAPPSMDQSVGVTVGVVIGLPIVDGGRRQAELAEAQKAVARAEATRRSLELRVRAEVAEALSQAGAASSNIGAAQSQVTAAEESYCVAQVRYANGKSIIVELLDSLRGLDQARGNLVAARARHAEALAALWRAIGLGALPSGV